MSVTKRFTFEERDYSGFAGKKTFREDGRFRASTRVDFCNPWQVDFGENANRPAANVDDLDGALRIGVTVGLFVSAVKLYGPGRPTAAFVLRAETRSDVVPLRAYPRFTASVFR